MEEMKLGAVETRFAEIIWENEPIASGKLVRKCQAELSWKKSTTYTVLKKLCEKGIFRNTDGTVTSVIGKGEFYSLQSEKFVEETFGGSLPMFIAAFTKRKQLSKKDMEEIRKMIDSFEEG